MENDPPYMWGWIGLGRTKSPLRKFFAMVRCTEDHQTIRRSFHVNSLVNIVKGPTDPRVEFCFNTRVTSFGHIASSYTKLDQISSSESHSWILLFYEAGWNLTIAFYSRMRSLTTDVVFRFFFCTVSYSDKTEIRGHQEIVFEIMRLV